MPDRRFSNGLKAKKSCHCSHGIAIHHMKKTARRRTRPCWYPGCKCKDYRAVKN